MATKNNKYTKAGRMVIIMALVLANIGCDQVSKTMIRHQVNAEDNLEYLNGHFVITSVENKGAFLSLGHNITGLLHNVLFIVLPAAFMLGLLAYLLFKPALNRWLMVALTFLAGGGIGNLYDRAAHGSVTDFIYMHWGIMHTGIFNMADVSVTTGAIMLLVYAWTGKGQTNALPHH